MNIEKIFRCLIVLIVVLIIAIVSIDYSSMVDLSNTTLDYEYLYDLSDSHIFVFFGERFFLLLLLTLIPFAVYAALFFFIKYSREFYILLTCLFLFIEVLGVVLVGSFTFVSSLEFALMTVLNLLDGALIAMMYLTPIKDRF